VEISRELKGSKYVRHPSYVGYRIFNWVYDGVEQKCVNSVRGRGNEEGLQVKL